MLRDLQAKAEIAKEVERLLRVADVNGALPTPIEDLIAAAELHQPKQSLLSESAIGQAPAHLRAAMAKLRRKVDALLDRRALEIHISPEIQLEGQRRFKQAHEISHHILPWQEELAYADDSSTLSWQTRQQFEQEANQAGAELLFQRKLFRSMASDYEIGFGAITELARLFGASYHATFRRYVETHRRPMVGLVLEASPCQLEPLAHRRREALHSRAWSKRYGPSGAWPRVLASPPYNFVEGIRRVDGLVPPRCNLSHPDLDDEINELSVELFSNSYRVFALIWAPKRERLKRKRLVVVGEPSET